MIWVLGMYCAVVIGAMLLALYNGMRFQGTLKRVSLPMNPPKVSTVVPARNEERNIGRCALGLTRQDYPNLEMVFVDDDSTDATPQILAGYSGRDARVRVVHTGGRPEGWNGKQWACHSGAVQATGDWLCFMDADTYAEPELISRTTAFAVANNIDMLTLQPWFEMRGLWERIVLPASIIPYLIVFPMHRVNDPKDKLALANGQFILIRRDVYQSVGGHETVRQRMMDDFSLAELVKGKGHRLFMADGSEVMRVRLYTNLREIRSSALKMSVEFTGGWFKTILSLLANFVIFTLPSLLLLIAVLANHTPAVLMLGGTVLFQLIYFALIRVYAFRAPPWSSITFPIGSMITSGLLIDGMVRLATGKEIKWKGRDLYGKPELEVPIKK